MRLDTAAAWVAALFLASCLFGGTVSLRLLLLGTALVLAAAVTFRPPEKFALLPPIWLPFVLWGAWALASLAWSVEPERSLKEWRNEVFYTGAALWVCYVGAQALHAVRIFPYVVAAAVAAACSTALYEFAHGLKRYAEGWHGGPGDHSSALLTLMPCVAIAGWYASRAGWPRSAGFAIWSLAALMTVSAYTTLNRTLWLGFAAEFVVLGALLLARVPRVLRSARVRLAAGAIALAVIVGCGAVLISIQTERVRVGAKAFERDHRLVLWPEIVGYIEARPLTGHGFGRGLLRDDLQQRFRQIDENLWHAHNLFLEALLQLGAPGVVLLLILLGAIVREGWRAARQANEAAAGCGMALLGVLAGVLARNMTDSLLVRQNALLFWGVVGVLLAFSARPWPQASKSAPV